MSDSHYPPIIRIGLEPLLDDDGDQYGIKVSETILDRSALATMTHSNGEHQFDFLESVIEAMHMMTAMHDSDGPASMLGEVVKRMHVIGAECDAEGRFDPSVVIYYLIDALYGLGAVVRDYASYIHMAVVGIARQFTDDDTGEIRTTVEGKPRFELPLGFGCYHEILARIEVEASALLAEICDIAVDDLPGRVVPDDRRSYIAEINRMLNEMNEKESN